MRQGRNSTSEGGCQAAEPGILARTSKKCQGKQRDNGREDSVTLTSPGKGLDCHGEEEWGL